MKIEFEFSTEGLPEFNGKAGISNAVSALLGAAMLANVERMAELDAEADIEVKEAAMKIYKANGELLRRMENGMTIDGKKP